MKNFLTTLIVVSCPLFLFGQTDKELTESTLSKPTIEGHIYFLASDELKGRETGKPGADIAARYLGTTLKRYGVSPVPGAKDGYYQEVKFDRVTAPSSIALTIDGKELTSVLTITKTNADLNASTIFLGHGLEGDYKKAKDVSGKVVLALIGSKDNQNPNELFQISRQKQALAKEAGAAGIIEIHSFDSRYWNGMQNYFSHDQTSLAKEAASTDDAIPHVWVNTSDELDMKAMKNAMLSIKGIENESFISSNVVGMVEGTDPELKDEFIIYSAHYDHVGIGQANAEGDSIYNGARDNAVGTVTVLSAAENIAKHPTKRSALFILFTAEEKGLLGSQYYVDNPLLPLNQMVYCFNSDNASYNDTSKATIVGLSRTTATDHIKDAAKAFGLEAIDDPAPEQNLFDRSDNVHFARKGIPSPTFSLGFTAFDQEVFKYYHQPSDNPDNLDYDYLYKFFQAYVLSCRNIANAETTPFWLEGDKYYEAGQALYKD